MQKTAIVDGSGRRRFLFHHRELLTREQVVMAVGWPLRSENPSFEAPLWRMWISSFGEYQIAFDESGGGRK